MEDLQVELVAYVSVIVAAFGVMGAVVYYAFILRNQARMRQTDLIMRLYTTFISEEFQKADAKVIGLNVPNYAEFKEKYGPFTDGQPIHIAIRSVASFFETIGILLKRNLVQKDLIQELFAVHLRWERLWPIISELRVVFAEPELGVYFEYLYNEEIKYRKSKAKA